MTSQPDVPLTEQPQQQQAATRTSDVDAFLKCTQAYNSAAKLIQTEATIVQTFHNNDKSTTMKQQHQTNSTAQQKYWWWHPKLIVDASSSLQQLRLPLEAQTQRRGDDVMDRSSGGLFNKTLFIVLLCDPVERLHRHYYRVQTSAYAAADNKTPRTKSAVDFHERVRTAIELIFNCSKHYHGSKEACLFTQDWLSGASGSATGAKPPPPPPYSDHSDVEQMVEQLQLGLYGFRVNKWRKLHPLRQFTFVRVEDFYTDPLSVMQQVYTFLGLDPAALAENAQLTRRIDDAPDVAHSKMLEHTHHLLDSFYSLSNKRLSLLLQQPRFRFKSYHMH